MKRQLSGPRSSRCDCHPLPEIVSFTGGAKLSGERALHRDGRPAPPPPRGHAAATSLSVRARCRVTGWGQDLRRRTPFESALLDLNRAAFVLAALYTLSLAPAIAAAARFLATEIPAADAAEILKVLPRELFLATLLLGLSTLGAAPKRSLRGMLGVSLAFTILLTAIAQTVWLPAALAALSTLLLLACGWVLFSRRAPSPRSLLPPPERTTRRGLLSILLRVAHGLTLLGAAATSLLLALFTSDFEPEAIQRAYAQRSMEPGAVVSWFFQMGYRMVAITSPFYLSTAALWASFAKRADRHSALTLLVLSLGWAAAIGFAAFKIDHRGVGALSLGAVGLALFCGASLWLLSRQAGKGAA